MQVAASHEGPDTTGPTIRLRTDRFDLLTRVLGCESETARAELLGVSTKTVTRARDGMIGEKFIAHTLTSLHNRASELDALNLRARFDDIFEVVHGDGEPVN